MSITTAVPTDDTADRGQGTGGALSSAARAGWALVGITMVVSGLSLDGWVDQYPVMAVAMVVLSVWGLGTVVVSLVGRAPGAWPGGRRAARVWVGVTVALVLVGIGLYALVQVVSLPGYGTDEIGFDQYAAQLVQHGMNPYTQSMAPAFRLFHIAPNGYTFTLSGRPVTTLSYPALSFLIYVPLLLAGWSSQVAVAVNVAAWMVAIVALFCVLPRRVRPLALVMGSLSIYVGYAIGGITDALFVPLVIGAVYHWDTFVTGRGWRAWRGPVLLGLAMAVKQTPWVLLPFLAAAVYLEASARAGDAGAGRRGVGLRAAGRYLGIAVGTFVVPNAVFIAADPSAWIRGVLTPITGHAVPAGQGLVGLTLFLGWGGGSLAAYSVAVVAVLALVWLAFVATYPLGRPAFVVFPAVVLFFSARSFGSYLVTLLPVAAVAAFAGLERPPPPVAAAAVGRRWRWVTVAVGVVAAAAVVVAVFLPAPLSVKVVSVGTSGELATVIRVEVQATNNSGAAVTPAFTVAEVGAVTAFWPVAAGPARLAPGQSADYTLLAPNYAAQPAISGAFQVVAFTSGPATVSRSSPYLLSTWHVSVVPEAVDTGVPVGRRVALQAELLNQFNQPVVRAGVKVYLSQISYGQAGLYFTRARINASQPGGTPVAARTDAQGVARFTVRGTQAARLPVSFQAYLFKTPADYPYGYSQIVAVRFVPRAAGTGP